jgi:hypothetical protein
MKTKNTYPFYFLLAAIGIASCQKLDREFNTDITQDQITGSFVNTQNLLNGVYAELREGFQEVGGEAMMASTTDEAEHTNENSSVQLFNQGAWTAFNNPADVWGPYFRAVRKANFFLENAAPGKVNLDQYKTDLTTLNQKLAEVARWRYEARFLRAFYYFELVKRYGGVPLITRTLNDADASTTQRTPLDQCIKFITDECDSAAANLPLTYATGELGRITKGAAMALKGRTLLYAASDLFNTTSWAPGYAKPELISLPAGDRMARWKAAADAAKALIDLAGTNYALAANYKALFNTNNSPEIIFARTGAISNFSGSANSNTFEAINFPIGFDKGQSGTTPTQDLVDAYEVKVNATTSVPFDWSNATYAAAPYANRDPRLGFSVVTNNSSLSTVSGITRNVQIWEGGRDGKPIPNATKTGYYLRKYINEGVNLTTNTGAAHTWIYMRLAEVYLNYAEALNEYSPGHADIKKYVDLVRVRNGNLANPQMPPLPAGLSQAQMRDRIRNERRIELAFEDYRAWDVRRWMLAPQTLGVPIHGVRIISTGTNAFTYTPITVENRVFSTKMYLFPIPQTELSVAQGLVQNPLW